MTHEVIRHLLDDYVMGDLADDARPAVAEHVNACDICRSEVQSLERIRALASELPTEIEPPAAAWSGIRSAIERDKTAVTNATPLRFSKWQRPLSIVAAAAVVALISSSGTYLYLRQHPAPSTGANIARQDSAPATLAAFTIEENNYLRTAASLQDLLDQQEGSLAPETVAQLKDSLRTIDEAILEARNALARDPANRMIIEMLTSSYKQKVDLLRRTTELTRGT
jgi:anti-sigma-K factor RskA